jgi:outer membrane protein OmpA-like peptidoglycan-associated protein
MKRSFAILAVLLLGVLILRSQDPPGSSDHPLFPRMKGFKIVDYDVTEPAAYKFYDEGGTEMIVAGRLTFIFYESESNFTPEKILTTVSANALAKGARSCRHDDTKMCLIVQQDNLEVWADLSAGDFYYTLRIVERAEVNQVVSAESIKSELESKGETVLYIRFSYRGSVIQPYSSPAVEALASVLKADPALIVEIEGHTDSEGADFDNKKISLDRANAIAAELIRAGVKKEQLTCTGMGESMPAGDPDSTEGKALNRRIIVRVKK